MIDEQPTYSDRLTRLTQRVLQRLAPEALWGPETEHARRCRTILMFWLLGAVPWPPVFAAIYGPVLGAWTGCWFCLLGFLALLVVPVLLRTTHSVTLAGNWTVAAMLGTLTALGSITGGVGAPALTWLMGAPLVAVHVVGLRAGLFWTCFVLIELATFEALQHMGVQVPQRLTPDQIHALEFTGLMGLVLLIATLAGAYEFQRQEAMRMAADHQLRLRGALQRTEDHAVRLAASNEALRISEEQMRQTTAALQASEALYRSLVQNSPMGMLFYTLDADDRLLLTEANPAAEQLTGLDTNALVGLTIEEAFPALRGTEVPQRYRVAARDGVPWTVEHLPYDDSGGTRGVYELRAFQTSPGKMVTVFMNITDRVQAEAAVRASEREIALQAGKAEVATDVLHNVGNVLSSVKVSSTLLRDKLARSEVPTLELVARTFDEHAGNLAAFLVEDPRGRKLPQFLSNLAAVLNAEQKTLQQELESLSGAVEHIARVVAMQQVHSRGHELVEDIRPADLVEQALNIGIGRHPITVVRQFDEIAEVPLQRHKVLQILVNLVKNARQALLAGCNAEPQVTVTIARIHGADEVERLQVRVADNGVGIAPEHLPHMFSFGFTTRREGHGFGLHSAANLAQDMGGNLTVASPGCGRGAVFTLELPLLPERSAV